MTGRTSDTLPSPASIQCHSLSLHYAHDSHSSAGITAVEDVSLRVRSGEIVALIGPSGCGKTSLLRLIAGLEQPSSGNVTFDFGDDLAVSHRTGQTAFVFQQPTLMPWRTATENVMLPLELIGSGAHNQWLARSRSILDQVGLADAADRFPDQLSGGMKMRVSLARALVTGPRVLLLDEPFAAIDDMLRSQLGQLVLELHNRHRFTAVLVTHNIAEAILLSHRVVVMHAGKLTKEIANPLSWPRLDEIRRSAEFGRFYGEVSDVLRGES